MVCEKEGKNFMFDKFLSRIYEEKACILQLLSVEGGKDFTVRAIQCYCTALELIQTSKEEEKAKYVIAAIEELSQDREVIERLEVIGQYDFEFLSKAQRNMLAGEDVVNKIEAAQADEEEEESDAFTLAGMGVALVSTIGIAAYLYRKFGNN